jgi:hypothetical protein
MIRAIAKISGIEICNGLKKTNNNKLNGGSRALLKACNRELPTDTTFLLF